MSRLYLYKLFEGSQLIASSESFIEIESCVKGDTPFVINIYPNTTAGFLGAPIATCRNPEELQDWREGLERAHAWQPEGIGQMAGNTETLQEMPTNKVADWGKAFQDYAVKLEAYMKETSAQERKSAFVELAPEPSQNKPVDANLKTLAAMGKPGISNVPVVAFFALGQAMTDGANKYGRFNWRETGSTVSVFVDAMARHLLGYYIGEDHAKDSRVHHLAHLMAGAAILLDAELHGVLNDDRMLTNSKTIADMLKLLSSEDASVRL